MNSGIYLITNVVNHKIYVGSSKKLKARKCQHFSDLKRGKHPNPHLQRAWNKDGGKAFHFEVLEYCEPEALKSREQWWVELLDSRSRAFGYNIAHPDRQEMSEETRERLSAVRKGVPKSEEHKAKISAAKGKKFPGLVAPDGKAYPEITNLRAFCREHGLPQSNICRLLQGKQQTSNGWTRY